MELESNYHSFAPSHLISEFLKQELREDGVYHPNLGGITQGGISNHYSMAILALYKLGAEDEEIVKFKQRNTRYRVRAKEDLGFVDQNQVQENNWEQYIGHNHRLLEFQRVFYQGLSSSKNEHQYVADALIKMKLSLPMGLFHPLIRLSFALLHRDQSSVADALAYMAIRYHDMLGEENEIKIDPNPNTTAEDSWLHISKNANQIKLSHTARGASLRVAEQLCSEKDVHTFAFATGFAIQDVNIVQKISEICLVATKLYLSEPALTTLHAVTASQSLADITLQGMAAGVHSENYVELWNYYWIWLTGLFLEKGAPETLPRFNPNFKEEITELDWDTMAKAAIQTSETHLIKMFYTCKWLYDSFHNNILYKLAAHNLIREQNAHPIQGYGLIR